MKREEKHMKKSNNKKSEKNNEELLFEENEELELEEEEEDMPEDDEETDDGEEEEEEDASEEDDTDEVDAEEEDGEDDTDEEEEEDASEEDDDKDLFVCKAKTHEPELDIGKYPSTVGKVTAEKKNESKYNNPWVLVKIPFNIEHPETGKKVTVTFSASKNLSPDGRLYPIVRGILGREPQDNFDIRTLEGMQALVTIEHRTDDSGNIWENVVEARKMRRKK